MRTAIVDRPIDVTALLTEVANPAHGASLLFVGTVRNENEGSAVLGLDYTAYRSMAERELAAIASEATVRWPECDVVVEHRIGSLALGDASVAIVIAHPHRGEAYDASRYVIEELKRRLPIWKRERYADGRSDWVSNASQGPAPALDGASR